MAKTTTIKTVFQFRRGTTAEWLANKDVTPAPGEPCFDIDLHELRIGDGNTTYEKLPVIGGVKLEVAGDGKSITLEDNVFKLIGYDAAEVGAQPQKTAEGLKWVVPSTETAEGLKTTVAELKSDVSNLQTTVINIQEIVTPDGGEPLLDRIEALETEVDGVDAKIDAKIDAFASVLTPDDDKVNTLMELINFVESHGKEALDMENQIESLHGLVGTTPVKDQILEAVNLSGHIAEKKANAAFEHVKYEISNTPAGTLVDYSDKEIRVMVPANAEFVKQTVGAGGDSNSYYMTFKTYAPNDNAVGYIEHLGNQSDSEILTSFSTDEYGRRYQPTWLALAQYDDATNVWNYNGKDSTASKYIGWDYQIDWYDADGVMISSDCIRINLSNEDCHNIVEPYYMSKTVKEVAVNGTLIDMVDGRVDLVVPKESDEIDVAEDGTLSIKSISFDKIAQGEESTIIMDGGSAAN